MTNQNDDNILRNLDAVIILIALDNKFTFLPELYKVFGDKHILEFLETFSGTTFNVPSKEDLAKIYRDIDIWASLSKSYSTDNVQRLCREYEITESTVRSIFKSVDERVNSNLQILKGI